MPRLGEARKGQGRLLDFDLQQAAEIVSDVIPGRLQQSQDVVAGQLPTLFGQFDPKSGPEAVLRYVEALQDWMAGPLECHQASGGYTDSSPTDSTVGSPPRDGRCLWSTRLLRRPTVLGTAAGQVVSRSTGPGSLFGW